MKKVELLAPAGNYESFLGAIHAGADAVYIGGQKFTARAFADNFTRDEVCSAVFYAHLFGRKVYLTLNTLVKESEMAELYEYLAPFYEAGLDGVIVQDFGVMAYVRRNFPEMELHASTQMTLTGIYGARMAKRLGAVRIVPARELSIEEIIEIRKNVDIEIETFIHGSLCYCYSGQCLFSSVLGGRSGNRGRCAQPCRLPYQQEECYPLSLKDQCTVQMLPELMQSGIDSFKIEGRMKKAEYAAGVTSIYRKYMDRYYADPMGDYQVEAKDLEFLEKLYIRSGLQDGYYHKHHGREMITLDKPSYAGSDEQVLQKIRRDYIDTPLTLPVKASVILKKGTPLKLTISGEGREASAWGQCVQQSQNRPLQEADIRKQLEKTGGTPFRMEQLSVEMEADCFLPIKALNELRREVLEQLGKRIAGEGRALPVKNTQRSSRIEEKDSSSASGERITAFYVQVMEWEQLEAVWRKPEVDGIYFPAEWMLENTDKLWKIIQQKRKIQPAFQMYAVLPHILRKRSLKWMEQMYAQLCERQIDGVLVRSPEERQWLLEKGYRGIQTADAGMYIWNREAAEVLEEQEEMRVTMPYELHEKEWKELSLKGREAVVYGRIPMMVSANCIKKTLSACDSRKGFQNLQDRYRKLFPVYTDCRHCYNVIYNSLPLSLHGSMEEILRENPGGIRVSFTMEDGREAERITDWYAAAVKQRKMPEGVPVLEYTRGHFKRGVE